MVYLAVRNAHEAQGRTQVLYGGINSSPTTSDERDTKRAGYCDMSQDMQVYHYINYVTNTVDIVKGSITPQSNDMGCLLHG